MLPVLGVIARAGAGMLGKAGAGIVKTATSKVGKVAFRGARALAGYMALDYVADSVAETLGMSGEDVSAAAAADSAGLESMDVSDEKAGPIGALIAAANGQALRALGVDFNADDLMSQIDQAIGAEASRGGDPVRQLMSVYVDTRMPQDLRDYIAEAYMGIVPVSIDGLGSRCATVYQNYVSDLTNRARRRA